MKPHKKREAAHRTAVLEERPSEDDKESGDVEPDKRDEELTDEEMLDREERGDLY